MTFMVTFIALLLERFFDCSHLRHWNWFLNLQNTLKKALVDKAPILILLVSLLPGLFVVLILQLMLHDVLYGLIDFIFELAILIYCFGPKNFLAEIFVSLASDAPQVKSSPDDSLIKNIFIFANRSVFAVVFWFVILGPVGAILYRMVALSVSNTKVESQAFNQQAWFFLNILDWVPVRFLTLLFALSGHFVRVLSCWRNKNRWDLDANETLLTECGVAALDDGSLINQEKNAISLLDRSFVIMLILIALTTLWF